MNTLKDSKIFKKSNSLLSGANGIVYLLFVGRNNYAANIQSPMKETLFAHESNVNQTVSKLTKAGKYFLFMQRSFWGKVFTW